MKDILKNLLTGVTLLGTLFMLGLAIASFKIIGVIIIISLLLVLSYLIGVAWNLTWYK